MCPHIAIHTTEYLRMNVRKKTFFFDCVLLLFLSTGGNNMSSDMQEIAITEDKPLLTGHTDPAKVRKAATITSNICACSIDVVICA